MKRNHATDDKIRDKKLEYDINRQEAKISALSSGKTDKYLPIKFKQSTNQVYIFSSKKIF